MTSMEEEIHWLKHDNEWLHHDVDTLKQDVKTFKTLLLLGDASDEDEDEDTDGRSSNLQRLKIDPPEENWAKDDGGYSDDNSDDYSNDYDYDASDYNSNDDEEGQEDNDILLSAIYKLTSENLYCQNDENILLFAQNPIWTSSIPSDDEKNEGNCNSSEALSVHAIAQYNSYEDKEKHDEDLIYEECEENSLPRSKDGEQDDIIIDHHNPLEEQAKRHEDKHDEGEAQENSLQECSNDFVDSERLHGVQNNGASIDASAPSTSDEIIARNNAGSSGQFIVEGTSMYERWRPGFFFGNRSATKTNGASASDANDFIDEEHDEKILQCPNNDDAETDVASYHSINEKEGQASTEDQKGEEVDKDENFQECHENLGDISRSDNNCAPINGSSPDPDATDATISSNVNESSGHQTSEMRIIRQERRLQQKLKPNAPAPITYSAATSAAKKRMRNARKKWRRRRNKRMANQRKNKMNNTVHNNYPLCYRSSEASGRSQRAITVNKMACFGMISIALTVTMTLGQRVTMIGTPLKPSNVRGHSEDLPRPATTPENDKVEKLPSSSSVGALTFNAKTTRQSFWETEYFDIGSYHEKNHRSDGPTPVIVIAPTAPPSISPTMTPIAPTFSPSFLCDSDPASCGCPNVRLTDYQGSIQVTSSKHECQRWDAQSPHAHSHEPQDFVLDDAYLAENYCRNPDNDPNGPWCYTTDPSVRFGYCDVPICGHKVITNAPTILSPKPRTSSPTKPLPPPSVAPSTFSSNSSMPTKLCPKADNTECGCRAVSYADYRGSIHSTKQGSMCERWNADWIIDRLGFDPKLEFSSAGLQLVKQEDIPSLSSSDLLEFGTGPLVEEGGHNFCRNPTNDARGAFCLTKASLGSTIFDEYHDDHGGMYVGINATSLPEKDGSDLTIIEDADYEYCDVPTCDPCSCMPPCGMPNLEPCGCPSFFQAEECCGSDEDGSNDRSESVNSCKCGYLKEACRKSLENHDTAFCEDAELTCCADSSDKGSCKCNLYEGMCSQFPFPYTCNYAADSCCGITDDEDTPNQDFGEMWASAQCHCDYYGYTSTDLGYGAPRKQKCSIAADYRSAAKNREKAALEKFFQDTGGNKWLNKKDWGDDFVPHCTWYGVTCNKQGIVTEIHLRGNNLVGGPLTQVALFPYLIVLDLAENKLTGSLNSTQFWKLRNLVHVDISSNSLGGHADMYFSPATVYANYSHNRFTSAGFKRFNGAYNTMEVVDLSHNSLDLVAVDFFRNLPVNVKELILSDNTMRGAFPVPFPLLKKLERFAIDNNDMEGPIPKVVENFPDVTVLNFAGNKFSQGIPPSFGYLEKLHVLNLTSNEFNSSIPDSLGRLEGRFCAGLILFSKAISTKRQA
mmetsp:Transcript_30292/g.63870  ORF Transcript_30292/g.63870 Transcript_30292/m.63870 type:complete len:1363 (-) Transcript_30292:3047-7135(-)